MTRSDLLERIRLDLRIVAEKLIDHGRMTRAVEYRRVELDIELDRIAEQIGKLANEGPTP